MKKIILFLTTFFVTHIIYAQKNFEGEITYSLHASTGDKPDAILKIYFGTNKIKLRFKEKEDFDKEEIIVLLDSAIKYIVNTDARTFRKKMLRINSKATEFQKKPIMGYTTTPVRNESNGLESLFGGSMQSSNVVFYVADSLYYSMPAIFEGNAELLAIQKNKIVLRADISFNKGAYESSDSTLKDDLVTAEAIDIKSTKVNEEEFTIPADYVSRTNNDYEVTLAATATVEVPVAVDTTVIQYPAKKKVTQKPSKSNSTKNSTKPAAIRKKE